MPPFPRAVRLRALLALACAAAACAPEQPSGPRVELRGYAPARIGRLRELGWRTDFSRSVVPLESVLVGDVRREAFAPVEDPRFAAASDVGLEDSSPVLVHRARGAVRAWPLEYLLARELAHDTVDGVPVAVTFCSLCSSARVWDRRLGDEVLELSVSGLVHEGNALLWDARTESLWRQLDGLAVVGAHAGRRLAALPAFTVSLGALRAADPDALVMLPPDPALAPPLARISGEDVARGVPPPWLSTSCPTPLSTVLATGGEADALLLTDPATASPYPVDGGGPGPVIGSTAAFDPHVDGRALTFERVPGGAVDRETGSTWNLLGEAVAGPLRGRALTPRPQVCAFRFALEGRPDPD